MVWGVQSAVQEDEAQESYSSAGTSGYGDDDQNSDFPEPNAIGLTSSVFLPLALGFFCIGCMHCGELLYKYYMDNVVEKLDYKVQ